MKEILVGASRQVLSELAIELLAQCNRGEDVDHTIYGHANDSSSEEITVQFSNDDMEGRDDLRPDTILVDIEES